MSLNIKTEIKLLFILVVFTIFSDCAFAQSRNSELINFGWKFILGDQVNAWQIDYNDKNWTEVNLPHDASIGGPFIKDLTPGKNANGFLPKNIGWYRKVVKIDGDLIDKKVILEFEGIHRDATVWLNGKKIGSNLNGYLDFEMDITAFLLKGDNFIAVRYDNTYKLSSRWYNGEGINRNVWLHFFDNLHVDRYGTFVTTPVITPEWSRVNLETIVENSYQDSLVCRIKSDIISPNGDVVASTESVVPLAGKEKYSAKQEFKIRNPQLWDLKSPNLYKVKTYLYSQKGLKDTYETSFGIRDIVMNAQDGLLLNGRKVFINGVCLHHDLGPLGASAFEKGYERRLERLKELGCNGIRLSHNPYPKFVLDWCDKNGILVFDEMYDKWSSQFYGEGANFEDHWQKDMEVWLKRDRNHPSVFIWSVGNEVQQTWKSPILNFKTNKMELDPTFGVDLMKRMTTYVRQIDPSRKITTALYPTRYSGIKISDSSAIIKGPPQAAFYSDVVSVNYMQKFFAADRFKYPQLTYILSEAATGVGGYSYFEYDHSGVVGQFYWGGTEYIGESFKWPSKGWINGIIDLCDNVKPVGYSIKSFYSEKPMIQLAVLDNSKENEMVWNDLKMSSKPMFMHWNWGDKKKIDVQTFSNCEEIELQLNSKSLGRKKMSDFPQKRMVWSVDYQSGSLVAIGYNNGIQVAESSLKTAGDPFRVVLKPEKNSLSADGLDLLYVNVEIQDKNGVLVPINNIKIDFKVKGPATIAGIGNGDIMSDESWQASSRSVYQGKALLILRSNRMEGNVEVKALAPKILSDNFRIESIRKITD